MILATNIAESSVTIPKVAYVIDSCRSLQVFWNSYQKKESAKLVWVSKSQVLKESNWMINFLVSWFLTLGLCCRPISVEGELVELVMARFIGWLLDHFSSSLTNTRVPLYWGYHCGCKCFRSAVLNLRPLMIPKVCCSLSLFSSLHLGFDNLLYSHWSDSSLIRKKEEDFFSLCIDMPNKGFHLVFGWMM